MTTEVEETQESGAAFRAKFEATQAEANALREAYASTFKHVKATDLVGVAPTEFAAKAAEIEAARKAEREAIAKEFLAERGLPTENLEALTTTLTQQPQGGAESDNAEARIASLGQLGGTVPNLQGQNLFGEDRIRAALDA